MTMDRGTIDQLWVDAVSQAIDDAWLNKKGGEKVRYHFAKLVAEYVIKSAPDYKMGYADGVATEREALLAFMKARGNT